MAQRVVRVEMRNRRSPMHRLTQIGCALSNAGLAAESTAGTVLRQRCPWRCTGSRHCRWRDSFIGAIVHQIFHHARIGQRRDISQTVGLVGGDLAQDAPHDFAGTGFRQSRRPLNDVR